MAAEAIIRHMLPRRPGSVPVRLLVHGGGSQPAIGGAACERAAHRGLGDWDTSPGRCGDARVRPGRPGEATIERGKGLVRSRLRFARGQIWHRKFGGRRVQAPRGARPPNGCRWPVRIRDGPGAGRGAHAPRRSPLDRVRDSMPSALAPTGNSYEYVEGGRFRFHVEIGLPLAGLIVAYRGWLVPRA